MFVVCRRLFRAFVSDSADFSLWLKRYLLGGRIGGGEHDAARERADAIGEDRSGFCWDHGMDSFFLLAALLQLLSHGLELQFVRES